jgi:hypothetical protein
VITSSTMPSAKYSCWGSPLIFANGSTAIEGLSGNGRYEPTGGLSVGEVSPLIRYALIGWAMCRSRRRGKKTSGV